MSDDFLQKIEPYLEKLSNHPIYDSIHSLDELRTFMQTHVYAVLDFMSLAKALQSMFAPINSFWTPPSSSRMCRFMNEIILAEESDELPNGEFLSHFEMYCLAMAEVEADSELVRAFVHRARESDFVSAMNSLPLPREAKAFMTDTCDTLALNNKIEIISSFCYGREKLIPLMFQSILDKNKISESSAPMFYYYLKRHIEVDGDSHGPIAFDMLKSVCRTDEDWDLAYLATKNSLESRLRLWDELLIRIKKPEDEYK